MYSWPSQSSTRNRGFQAKKHVRGTLDQKNHTIAIIPTWKFSCHESSLRHQQTFSAKSGDDESWCLKSGHKATKNSHCKMYAGMLAMAIKTLIFMVDFHKGNVAKPWDVWNWGTEIIGHTLNGTVQRLQNHSLPGNTWTLTNSRPFSVASTWSGIPVETWVNCPTWICMTPTNPNWCETSFVPPSKTPRVTAAEAGRSITVCNSGCGAPNFCGCICEKFQRQRVHRKFAHQLWSPGSALFNKTM